MTTRLKNMMQAVAGLLTKMTENRPKGTPYQIGRGQRSVDADHRRILRCLRADTRSAETMRQVVAERAANWANADRDRSRERPYSMGGIRLPNPPRKVVLPYKVRLEMRRKAELIADGLIQSRKSEVAA